jgi:hypothetical protein
MQIVWSVRFSHVDRGIVEKPCFVLEKRLESKGVQPFSMPEERRSFTANMIRDLRGKLVVRAVLEGIKREINPLHPLNIKSLHPFRFTNEGKVIAIGSPLPSAPPLE